MENISVAFTLIPDAISASIAGMPSVGGGHLDHEVGPVDHTPEPVCLGDRAIGVLCEVGGYFEADVPVVSTARVVDAPEQVCGPLNVCNGQTLVYRQ